ncbi:hypothetical protein ACMGE9_08605 [Macrococcus sp. EM39E]|uniref:hypothetical protein n=1 Tax=Macrococcus animalis TaxID=3395467 RepID=UPI0039BDBC02
MFSSAKYSSGQMLLFGLIILIPNAALYFSIDKPSVLSLILCAIGLNYLINDPKEQDEREQNFT